ncbi:FAD-binding oxidoreductase [Komagataeibacter sp. FNDCF1]|uniref:NAD(P)/FAD-dependent oxidoreductase n=1 Tax=Komagataeibacter sp. FNDCF1 TaxID=2878681 RepID=UPI001E410C4C|nr:FAD-binding oxidoreductase [Komagataeibacter sp. FNDCF1]MCE2563310.1 FAD-binding oxidoreductase [Komagataeibacter sp. FNDCF1]
MSELASSYDVVIVGGGVVGSAVAFFLATNSDFDGRVLVIEKDWTYRKAATALSSSSIRHQFSNALNVRISMFGVEFIQNFPTLAATDVPGPDLNLTENGYLFIANDQRGVDILRRNARTQQACGADTVLLDNDDIRRQFPWMTADDIVLGSYGPRGEGWFDNMGYLNGLRHRARASGVTYIEDEVVGLGRSADRITHVTLRSGRSVAAGTVVNAAGTRGTSVARMAALDLPVEPRRRSLFVVDSREKLDGKIPLFIDTTGVFFRPEGRYYLAGTVPEHDPAVDPDDFSVAHDEFEEQIWPALAERIPAFEALKVINSWAGHYDYCTLDHNVIVGPSPEVPNFLFANGFSGHGLQQSPAIGRGLAEMIVYGAYRSLDLSPLGYQRVIDKKPFIEEAVI